MIEFRVEYRRPSDRLWTLDAIFESMGEAMDHMTRESLIDTGFEHRTIAVKSIESEVALVRALDGFE